jgi:RNA-directed DNA polymerase
LDTFPIKNLSKEEVRQRFLSLKSRHELSELIGIDYSTLLEAIRSKNKYYSFSIPKRNGGTREINSPNEQLKEIQKRLSYIFSCTYESEKHGSFYGFRSDRDILKNANAHVNCQSLLNIDILDFFGSITFLRVRNLFIYAFDQTIEVAESIAKLCSFDSSSGKSGLPQGAPTSPVISNMICMSMDRKLIAFATKYNCWYTRYADDLTFSSKKPYFPKNLAEESDNKAILCSNLLDIIKDNLFSINHSKSRIRNHHNRREVTGLVVNEEINVKKKYFKKVRLMLHLWENYGTNRAMARFASDIKESSRYFIFKNRVKSSIEFIGQVKGKKNKTYLTLMLRLSNLDSNLCNINLNYIYINLSEDSEYFSKIFHIRKIFRILYGIHSNKYFEISTSSIQILEIIQSNWISGNQDLLNWQIKKGDLNYTGEYDGENYQKRQVTLFKFDQVFNKYQRAYRHLPMTIRKTGGFMNYERGLDRLKKYSNNTSWKQDFLALEVRLRENLHSQRILGSSEKKNQDRMEIIFELNRICITNLEIDFNELCFENGPELRKKILFLSSEPTDAGALSVNKEYRQIYNELEISKLKEKFLLVNRGTIRPIDFTKEIFKLEPDILHFSGHGTGKSGLCFEDDDGNAILADGESIYGILESAIGTLECVFLNACFSEEQAKAIAKKSKYVIGMNDSISDTAAIAFSCHFYQALGSGKDIEQSFNIAKAALGIYSNSEKSTPVLMVGNNK